ncbi:hypothetical protein [Pseudonocardia sp. DLS-67]
MWISLGVPVAVLLATLLLQRLEAKLLSTPQRVDHRERPAPGGSVPLLAVGPLEPPPPHPEADRPVLRGAA